MWYPFNEYTQVPTLSAAWLLGTQKQEENYLKVNFRFPVVELCLGVAAEQRCMQCAHTNLIHLTVSAPVALAHSMDDQKRPTAADHYANDTLSKSPESAATWQPLGIESGTLKEGWRITVSAESKAESEIFIMYCTGKFLLELSLSTTQSKVSHAQLCHSTPPKNMKQPGTRGWWGEFRDWYSVNESEHQCGPLCRW